MPEQPSDSLSIDPGGFGIREMTFSPPCKEPGVLKMLLAVSYEIGFAVFYDNSFCG